ncbi:hypothetical protein L195_g054973 [Trifolium pratense]|uniref:Sulfate transporter n=1 Tax=Trifolium pratense TaxID=57577 RepID=A0A2K3KIW9_TRIPR|nr:hypothetical protein L195_g054973 [Trifolium pratense]
MVQYCSTAGRRMENDKVIPGKGNAPLLNGGKQSSNLVSKGGEDNINFPGQQPRSDGIIDSKAEKKGSHPGYGVRVGDIDVKLGARNVASTQKIKEGLMKHSKVVEQSVVTVKDNLTLLRSYRSLPVDVEWAHNGIVATVFNGEAISVVQNRILDAGFIDVVFIPMGADKVFVRRSSFN